MTQQPQILNIIAEVTTSKISNTLNEMAVGNFTTVESLDFRIIATKHFAIFDGETLYETYELDETLNNYIKNQSITIAQKHTIEVFKVEQKTNLGLALIADSDNATVKVSFTKDLNLSKQNNVELFLYNEICKLLAKNNYLLYIYSKGLKSNVKKLFLKYPNRVIKKATSFIAAKADVYVPGHDDKIVFSYIDSNNKQDIYDRNFAKQVLENELLIEYYKKQNGIDGRNCKGKYIIAKEPNVLNYPDFFIDSNTIRTSESDLKIEYFARKDGYLYFDNKYFKVTQEIEIDSVSSKTTGSIHAVEQNLHIQVNQKNPIVDAVGPSMTIKATSVTVNGSVSENAKIEAQKVIVNGVTHATSNIFSSGGANINSSRGTLNAKYVEIQKLEGGIVFANTAYIEEVFSGTVRCNSAVIKKMHSNCKIIASREIRVFDIVGNDNQLICASSATTDSAKKIEDLKHTLKQIQPKINDLKLLIDRTSKDIKSAKAGLNNIASSKNNIHKSPIHDNILKNYKNKLKQLETSTKQLEELEDQKSSLMDSLAYCENNILGSSIMIFKTDSLTQSISFELNKKSYHFALQHNMVYPTTISLQRVADNIYYAVAK